MRRAVIAVLLLALLGPAAASGGPGPSIMPPGAKIGTISIVAAGVAQTQFVEGPWQTKRVGRHYLCQSIMYNSPTTYLKQLDHGPGHYPCNALPWQGGTVILSGHRVTHTTPFDNLGEVRLGERIRLHTAYGSFSYRIVPPPKGHDYVTRGYGATTAPCIYRDACGILEMPKPNDSPSVKFRKVGWIFRWHFSDGHRILLLACNPKRDLSHRVAVFGIQLLPHTSQARTWSLLEIMRAEHLGWWSKFGA